MGPPRWGLGRREYIGLGSYHSGSPTRGNLLHGNTQASPDQQYPYDQSLYVSESFAIIDTPDLDRCQAGVC